jgi:DNA-binding PadR family transcriptional regulator
LRSGCLSLGSFWGESYGQIYPALKQMAADKLITASPAATESKRRRRYRLTKAGRAVLKDWLALPFQNDPPRNEFLLKLFFGKEAGIAVTLGHVRNLQERNRQTRETLLAMRRMLDGDLSANPHRPYWQLTLSLGIALNEAALAWGKQALSELSSKPAGPANEGHS